MKTILQRIVWLTLFTPILIGLTPRDSVPLTEPSEPYWAVRNLALDDLTATDIDSAVESLFARFELTVRVAQALAQHRSVPKALLDAVERPIPYYHKMSVLGAVSQLVRLQNSDLTTTELHNLWYEEFGIYAIAAEAIVWNGTRRELLDLGIERDSLSGELPYHRYFNREATLTGTNEETIWSLVDEAVGSPSGYALPTRAVELAVHLVERGSNMVTTLCHVEQAARTTVEAYRYDALLIMMHATLEAAGDARLLNTAFAESRIRPSMSVWLAKARARLARRLAQGKTPLLFTRTGLFFRWCCSAIGPNPHPTRKSP